MHIHSGRTGNTEYISCKPKQETTQQQFVCVYVRGVANTVRHHIRLEACVGSTYKQVQMAEFKWQSKA
jgi:hypothetical protein